jgi:hypothetical protein
MSTVDDMAKILAILFLIMTLGIAIIYAIGYAVCGK